MLDGSTIFAVHAKHRIAVGHNLFDDGLRIFVVVCNVGRSGCLLTLFWPT